MTLISDSWKMNCFGEWNLLPPWPQEWSFSPEGSGFLRFLHVLLRSLVHRAAIPIDNDPRSTSGSEVVKYWELLGRHSSSVTEWWTGPWTLLSNLKNVPVKATSQQTKDVILVYRMQCNPQAACILNMTPRVWMLLYLVLQQNPTH